MWNDTNEMKQDRSYIRFSVPDMDIDTHTPPFSQSRSQSWVQYQNRRKHVTHPAICFFKFSSIVDFILFSCLLQSYYERWCIDWPVPLDMLNTIAMLYCLLCICVLLFISSLIFWLALLPSGIYLRIGLVGLEEFILLLHLYIHLLFSLLSRSILMRYRLATVQYSIHKNYQMMQSV